MSNIQVNTDKVVETAGRIEKTNSQLKNDFSIVQTAIAQLDLSWNGPASNNAIEAFNKMKAVYPNARYEVLNDFAKFLYIQVGESYNQTENTNTNLADYFK